MNKQPSDEIWQVCNKLRGAFEPTEMLKMVLFLLLLKYIENEKGSLSVYDERYSLDYLALTYGKMIQPIDIATYINKLEQEKKLDSGLISETVEVTLIKMGEEKVVQLCNLLRTMDLNHNKVCFECAVALIDKTINEVGRTAGLIGTNYSLAQLEAKLLDVKEGEMVYDPYCGTGLSSNLAAHDRGIVYMQDINVGTICIATILALLNQANIGAVKCGDTILNPMMHNQKWDKIIMEPPFGIRYDKSYIQHLDTTSIIYPESLDTETLAIRHAISRLEDKGMAIVLIPMGVLFKGGKTGEIRERLVSDNYIETILELPAGVLVGTGIPSVLLVLKKDKTNDDIFMINSKEFFDKDGKKSAYINDNKISEITNIFRSKKEIEGISKLVSLEAIVSNEYNLCPLQYLALKGSDDIIVEDVGVYINKNNELSKRLMELDVELSKVRSRFVQ